MLKIKRKLNAIIAIEIILTMTLYYFIFVGVTTVTYAIDIVKTNNENIDFEAYFLNSNGEKVSEIEMTTDSEKQYLYVDISVHNEGYFNGSINLENNNFNIKPNKLSTQISEISGNEVKLNQINAGNTVTIKLEIESNFESKITEESLVSNTKVTLKGQYINSKNVEKEKKIDISGNAEVAIKWKSSEQSNAELECELLTNHIYNIQNESKRVIQFLINSQITNNNYPVKNTELNLNVPQEVKKIEVHARSSKATNSNILFDENNYIYNKEENKLTIKLDNDDNKNISWERNSKDILVVTYLLNEDTNLDGINITVDDKITTYDDKELTANKVVNIEDDIDGIITTELKSDENSIFKGKLYIGEDRDYKVLNKVNIDFLNEQVITLSQNETSYLKNDSYVDANIIYKQTKIDKNEFFKIFGEDGNINIKNNNGIVLANINKDSETDENGKMVVNYSTEEKDINFVTSIPKAIGVLNIENTKTIKSEGYTREEIEKLTGIKEKVTTNENASETVINLKETESKADIKLDTNKISTLSDKQTITVDAILLANDESQDLYKNPNVTIRLPKQIELISAQYAALYKNGLEVEEAVISENKNKQSEINIKLNGEQLKYDAAGGTTIRLKLEIQTSKLTPSQKTQIEMIYTNQNKDIEKNENIDFMLESQYGLMLYNKAIRYNEKDENVETIDTEAVYGSLDVKSKSKDAKLQTALINNYEQEVQNIVLIGKIPTNSDENSFNATLNDIRINNSNAKIYYSNNKDATTNDNFWTENNEGAVKYKIVIDKLEPQEILAMEIDFNIPGDLSYNVKGNLDTNVTYIINNVEQKNSSKIILKTENVNSTTLTNEINEKQSSSNNVVEKSVENENIKLDVTATIGEEILADGADIKEGETIKYTLKITNNSGHDYSNININAIQKNGYVWDIVEKTTQKHTSATEYTEVKTNWYEITDKNEIDLGKISTLKNGSSVEISYKAVAYMLNNNQIDGNDTYGTIYLSSEDGNINQNITTIKNTIKSAKLQIILKNANNEGYQWLEGGSYVTSLVVTNLQSEDLNNLKVQVKLSNKLSESISTNSFQLSNLFISYNENEEEIVDDNNIILDGIQKNENGEAIVNFKILNLKANSSKKMNMILYAENINENNVEVWITATATTMSENVENYSTKFERNIYKNHTNIDVSINALKQGVSIDENTKLNNDDIIEFIAKIENNDNNSTKINLSYDLDDTLEIQKVYIYGNESENLISKMNDSALELNDLDLTSGENISIVGVAKVDGRNAEKITNTISAFDNNTGASYSKSVSFNINPLNDNDIGGSDEPSNPNTPNTPSDPNTPSNPDNPEKPNNSNNTESTEDSINKKYKITGAVWVDENGDGRKSLDEKKIAQMKVSAIDSKTNSTVETTKTDLNGQYELNLLKGEYIIAFYYDNTLYKVTTYKAKGVAENENSDAIDREFTIDGKGSAVGATDIISLEDNLTDIDIGLINKNKFSLDIQKYVSKIIVQNQEGTKIYEQKEGTTLAKAEIKAKHLKDSLVVIEYKIKVTNVGDVEGYAKNIEDVLPSSLTFKSSMNPDWYKSGSSLYNSSLANTPIKPGESKELTLTITKTMTESNSGLINNKAKVEKSSNLQGIENQNISVGSANVVISVSTGALINYVAMVLTIFVSIALLAYLFVKKTLIK